MPRRVLALLVLATLMASATYLLLAHGDGAAARAGAAANAASAQTAQRATVTTRAAARPATQRPTPAPPTAQQTTHPATPLTGRPTARPTHRPTRRAVPSPGTHRVVLAGGRSYLLAMPSRLPAAGRPLPLLVVVHGRSNSARLFSQTTGFTSYAEQGRAVVVFPDATAPSGGATSWNAGTCCQPAVSRGVDDVGYLTTVIEDVTARVPVDRTRVWYVGFSNGAMMGYRLACERPDLVDAVVAVAGSRVVSSCSPARSIPFLHVHGDADGTVPYKGTLWSVGLQSALPSAWASLQPIATAAGCDGWSEPAAVDGVSTSRATGCRVPVERVRIAGLGHRFDPREQRLAWSFLTGLPGAS